MELPVPDGDPHIIYSNLCRTLSLDGVTVDVQIYRLEHDAQWLLEVVNDEATSTVWDDLFVTDADAYAAFALVVREEGMRSFIDDGDVETLH
jgi:hypothetical protein